MIRKKFVRLYLCLAIIAMAFSVSCGGGSSSSSSRSGGQLNIVVTTFPIYDWTMNVLGDNASNVNVRMLIDSGVDLHSYQPSTDDIIEIANADLFIYGGGNSDGWVEGALNQSKNADLVALNLIEKLGNRVLFDDHDHGDHHDDHDDHHDHDHDDHDHDDHDHDDHDDHHDHDHDHHGHDDEHIWLSLVNAQILVDEIAAALAKIDTANASLYFENAKSYNEELDELHHEYEHVIKAKSKKAVVVADRFPFAYMFEDYGLEQHAAFSGCSAEVEASFDTIKRLAEKTDELGIKTIVKTESKMHNIAETVRDATRGKNQDIIVLDSMQSIVASDLGNVSYISIMKDNLAALDTALNY